MSLDPDQVRDLAGLPAGAVLPETTPPPPWATRVEAVMWWHRGGPAAQVAVDGALSGRRRWNLTVGAFVRYLGSPVGAYSEVFASPALVAGRRGLPSVTVPLIAVDSLASVAGGRAHWALPKTLASFVWTGPGPAARLSSAVPSPAALVSGSAAAQDPPAVVSAAGAD